jgi:hypothetical protein
LEGFIIYVLKFLFLYCIMYMSQKVKGGWK